MTPEEEHANLAYQLTGLVRDVVMLHAPDRYALCRGCAATPPDFLLAQAWPCRTIRLIREGMGL